MATAAGAVAEQELRRRHQQAWPRNLYVYDNDEVRRGVGRKLLLESPAGRLVLAAEYKAADEGPLDLAGLQFQVAADAVADDLPAFAVQFTHPRMDPPQPWCFRLWPLNRQAATFGPVELTEQRYVQFLYVLQGEGDVRAGVTVRAGDHARIFEPWSELAHLDDRWPAQDVWPSVRPARIVRVGPGRRSRLATVTAMATGRGFVSQRGRPLDNGDMAQVQPLALHRPTLGALRARPTNSTRVELMPTDIGPRPAPVELARTREVRDRWDRLRWDLDRRYRRMWETERASDDNRDMWRAYDRDGSLRWAQP